MASSSRWVLLLLLLGLLSPGRAVQQVDVFSMGEGGYYCIKIPSLTTTLNGTLIATGEGRRFSCSDYTWTDLVYKRSFDNGATWTSLALLYSNSSLSLNVTTVIGNAAPVVETSSGRVLLPFTRNNLEVWLTYSDDEGATWASPFQIPNVTGPEWRWVGTGPPASLQLSSGRIITPSYRSRAPHWTDGEITHSYIMYSDDLGKTWQVGGHLNGVYLSSECQAVQLTNQSVYVNARGILTNRIQAISDDGGESFGDSSIISGLVEPLEGCEGSTIRHPLNDWLFFSIPNDPSPLRYNMTLWVSKDQASSWQVLKTINSGRTAYSALSVLQDDTVGLLYERSNLTGIVFVPQHISFTIAWRPDEH